MKKFICFIFLCGFSIATTAQTKHLIFFKDKGDIQLSKVSATQLNLSEKSIERRSKVMKALFTYEDLPISKSYLVDLQQRGIKIVHKLNWFNAVSVYLTDNQLDELRDVDYVKNISQVRKFKSSLPVYKKKTESNLPKYSTSDDYEFDYGESAPQAELCDVPYVHKNFQAAGKGVIVGILDSGFGWKKHKALQNLDVLAEWDFVGNDSTTYSLPGENINSESHGTFSLSVMAGFDEGNLIGPAFEASFLLAKTEDIDSETIVEEDNYAAAMEWMDKMGAAIVSASLGYSVFDNIEDSYTYENMDGKTAICTRANELAFERGILCVASAGNEGNKAWKYITPPADGFNTVSVGSVDLSNTVAAFSSIGPTFDGRIKPEVVALGIPVYGADPKTNDYYYSSGTSYSCPMVAGIAAQIKSFYPEFTNVELRQALINSGDNVNSPNNNRGYGLVSAFRALGINKTDSVNVYELQNPYPNPFNNTTIIMFNSPRSVSGSVEIFNILGQKVRRIFSGNFTEGGNLFSWNGIDNLGQRCASGIYIVAVNVESELISKKIVLIK